jgi:hypothetical protein
MKPGSLQTVFLKQAPAAKIEKLLPSEWKKLNAKADTGLGDDIAKIVRVA